MCWICRSLHAAGFTNALERPPPPPPPPPASLRCSFLPEEEDDFDVQSGGEENAHYCLFDPPPDNTRRGGKRRVVLGGGIAGAKCAEELLRCLRVDAKLLLCSGLPAEVQVVLLRVREALLPLSQTGAPERRFLSPGPGRKGSGRTSGGGSRSPASPSKGHGRGRREAARGGRGATTNGRTSRPTGDGRAGRSDNRFEVARRPRFGITRVRRVARRRRRTGEQAAVKGYDEVEAGRVT